MKIALITGGSRGLGKSMCLNLAQKGNDIILTYNSKKSEALEVVAQIKKMGQKAAAIQLDVSKANTFDAFAKTIADTLKKEWDRNNLDFLVNNAGTGIHASFMETTQEQFDQLMNIHLKAPFFLTQKLLAFI